MASVHIGIGHDDYLVVTELFHIQSLAVFFRAEADAQSRIDILDFLAFKDLVLHGFLHIQNLASQRQDSLSLAVASLLGGSTGRIPFDQKQLAKLRIPLGAVGQLARQAIAGKNTFALNQLPCLAGGMTSLGSQNHLVHDHLGFLGMFFQEISQLLAHQLGHHRRNLAIAQFGLGLAFKLRLGHFDRNDGGQAFAEVVPLDLDLLLVKLVKHARFPGIIPQCLCQA